jgi:hypothetical protein
LFEKIEREREGERERERERVLGDRIRDFMREKDEYFCFYLISFDEGSTVSVLKICQGLI